MKRFLLFIVLSAISFGMSAENRDSLWNSAVESYSNGDYQGALASFQRLEDEGYVSRELYYNIGNSYYKMDGYIAYAILYYEKALKLDPSYKDAAVNLELARQFTLDRIEELPEFVLVTWTKELRDLFSSNVWAYIAIALLAMVVILVLLFRYARSLAVRKISFAFAIIMFTFTAVSVAFSFSLKSEHESDDQAVVIIPVSSVKSSPNDSGQSLLIIHEGTKVTVLEELGQWRKIELSDGRQGWILRRDIEII